MSFFYSRRHEFSTSKHFPTTKVNFLTIKVVLAITRTTVFRNATDDFRTESERLAYGSRPYMQVPVFGGGEGIKFQTALSRKRLKMTLYYGTLSIPTKSRSRYRLKVVWKLYEVV